MSIISIDGDSEHNGTVFYHIAVKLPLRHFVIKKRYRDFEELVANLCDELGIDKDEFPSQLPAKRINWFKTSTNKIIEERKVELGRFLTEIISDTSIQNSPVLHQFLQLPVNFKFTPSLLRSQNGSGRDMDLDIDAESIDETNWLEVYRKLKAEVLESQSSVGDKYQLRNKVNKVYQPCLGNLVTSLNKSKLDKPETKRRHSMVGELQNQLTQLISTLQVPKQDPEHTSNSGSRRVFGAQETAQTMPLDNKELLQSQVQIHREQDQEIEQLRKIIQRQRQIGNAINQEVEEQNEMLDQFAEEVDNTSDKVNAARARARRIL